MHAANIREIFIAAIHVAPGRREELLDQMCTSEEERAAVLELLSHDNSADADSRLEQPIGAIRSQLITGRFGPYEIQELVGRGGMGAVYKAERVDGEVRQTVAIKVLDRECLDPRSLSRFRRERQI